MCIRDRRIAVQKRSTTGHARSTELGTSYVMSGTGGTRRTTDAGYAGTRPSILIEDCGRRMCTDAGHDGPRSSTELGQISHR
eukprot:2611172-Rhodomonas_salina.1